MLEHTKHEFQVTELLKAAGIYNAHSVTAAGTGRRGHGDTWFELFQKQMDDERLQIMALKGCLVRFASKLTREESESLLDAGIILGPAAAHEPKPSASAGGGGEGGGGTGFMGFLKHI